MDDILSKDDIDALITEHTDEHEDDEYVREYSTDKRYQRVPLNSPERCQGISAHGQCQLRKIDGSDYCIIHGGFHQEGKNKIAGMKNYQLNRYYMRAAEQANSSGLKSLRDEIGILRMMLESRLNSIDNPNDLIMASVDISNMVNSIAKLVEGCHRIDKDLDNLMDKSQLIVFAEALSNLLETFITDKELLQALIPQLQALVDKHIINPGS